MQQDDTKVMLGVRVSKEQAKELRLKLIKEEKTLVGFFRGAIAEYLGATDEKPKADGKESPPIFDFKSI